MNNAACPDTKEHIHWMRLGAKANPWKSVFHYPRPVYEKWLAQRKRGSVPGDNSFSVER